MRNVIIDKIEKKQMKKQVPHLKVGDQIRIFKLIREGKKERLQRFEGTIIKIRGSNSRKSIRIRKVMDGVGVEKVFLIHTPLVDKIEILQRSKVRRAKLYYLRKRIGSKANRLKAIK